MIKAKDLALLQIAVVIVSGLVFLLVDRREFLPFMAGALLISVNFGLLGLLWQRILEKKSVAITIGLVVIKYAILAAVLYIFVKEWNLPLLPLFVGLTTIGASFVLAAVLSQLRQSERGDKS